MWVGYGFRRGDAYFRIPDSQAREFADGVYDDKTGLVHFRNCTWFTNLDIKKRHEEMILVKRYKPEVYSKYVNFGAIEVPMVADIPCDYDGLMGVPITFMDKYNPSQFELVGYSLDLARPISELASKGECMFGGKCFYTTELSEKDRANGFKYHRLYDRLVIRNLHPETPKEA